MNYFYVGFSAPKHIGIMGRLQMWLYKSKFTHSYIRFRILEKELVYHSTGAFGSHFDTYEYILKHKNPVFEYRIKTNATAQEMWRHCLKRKYSYGTFQMIGSGIAYALKLKKNPFFDDDGDEEHCSMSQGLFMKKFANQIVMIDKCPSLWAPKDIQNVCVANNFEQTLKVD